MDLSLQFGYGMMKISETLVTKWGRGCVILSPRDLEPDQIPGFAKRIRTRGGETLLDPQFYEPRANWPRLTRHSYWPSVYSTQLLTDGALVTRMLRELRTLNSSAGCEYLIVPGFAAGTVDDDWIGTQELFIEHSSKIHDPERLLATICLSSDAVRSENQIHELLSIAESWNVSGFYLVAEHPKNEYLVEDPVWLTNLLILIAGLRLAGKRVIVGYGSHQLLCLATANASQLASGNWMNMRSFSIDRYILPEEEEAKRKAIWYYCPQALSEYKPMYLDMAQRGGILDQLVPEETLNGGYADVLFSGAQPSSTGFGEPNTFLHYLYALAGQCQQARRETYEETFRFHQEFLDQVERKTEVFRSHGVFGQDRDFSQYIDVSRAALAALNKEVGFMLSKNWLAN